MAITRINGHDDNSLFQDGLVTDKLPYDRQVVWCEQDLRRKSRLVLFDSHWNEQMYQRFVCRDNENIYGSDECSYDSDDDNESSGAYSTQICIFRSLFKLLLCSVGICGTRRSKSPPRFICRWQGKGNPSQGKRGCRSMEKPAPSCTTSNGETSRCWWFVSIPNCCPGPNVMDERHVKTYLDLRESQVSLDSS